MEAIAPQFEPAEASATQLERAAIRAPVWPTSRLASGTLMLLLIGELCLPTAIPGSPPAVLAAAFVPAVLSAVAARMAFETVARPQTNVRLTFAVVVAAGVGLGVAVPTAIVLGANPRTGALLLSGPALCVTLRLAAAARAFEVRRGTATRRLFFVGSASQAGDLQREVSRRGDMRLAGVADVARLRVHPAAAAELLRRVADANATTLIMSAEAIRDESLVAAASELNMRGVRVRALNHFYEYQFAKVPLSELSPSWFLFDVAEIHRARPYGLGKRIVETTTAAAVLTIAAPVLPLIALLVKLSGPGSVFFRQRRVGKEGDVFWLTKFRTMSSEPIRGAGWGTEHRHRITSVGRMLRRFRLDELPQLWHVVRGHLSLVGPRPEQPEIVERLQHEMDFYGARHCVRPGLTGWAQINYGYGGSQLGTLEKLQYDFFYIKNQSLRLDLVIMASTLRAVLRGRGE